MLKQNKTYSNNNNNKNRHHLLPSLLLLIIEIILSVINIFNQNNYFYHPYHPDTFFIVIKSSKPHGKPKICQINNMFLVPVHMPWINNLTLLLLHAMHFFKYPPRNLYTQEFLFVHSLITFLLVNKVIYEWMESYYSLVFNFIIDFSDMSQQKKWIN